MQLTNSLMIAVTAAVLALTGCDTGRLSAKPAAPAAPAAAKLEPGGVKRITLKDIETKRLGIEFAEVSKTGERLTMHYNALLYDPMGREWAFASPEANTYVRMPLKVEAIEGDKVYLKEGPPPGTKLVTAGAAELYGIEFGIGK
jgi:hypothetical protein